MPLIYPQDNHRQLTLAEPEKPQLHRELFPYSSICRTPFDGILLSPKPSEKFFITDTTFRDGQQARPPYSVKQIAKIFDLLHKLGGKSGLIQASEFFIYSAKDRKAIEMCRSRGYRFPRITAWTRAHKDDLKLARDMEFDEVGMLTSVSDYHIFMKLGKTRQQAMDMYLDVARQALEWGIIPRCHFEDVTRADIYGFCLPLAQKLMELGKEASMPVKIRLCDTMGYGVPYAGAALPRSVQRIVRAFIDEASVPGEYLEWHGHNDFHKVLVNGVSAWLSGCAAVNATLLGFGERTGNTPLEALVIEYISLTGEDAAANTPVISEIADFFEKELDYHIPHNYPFVGRDFNATSAGVHVDGLDKCEEIYNIFDTEQILSRTVPIIITDKSGRAGVSYWINNTFKLSGDKKISKRHPEVGHIYDDIMSIYEKTGRNTSFAHDEMLTLVQCHMPELFESEFAAMKRLAGTLSSHLLLKMAKDVTLLDDIDSTEKNLELFITHYSFIQYIYITDTHGKLFCSASTAPAIVDRYAKQPKGFDLSDREWFKVPMQTGNLHIMDVYQSYFTGKLIITVSCAITNAQDDICGVISADIQLEELLRRAKMLKADEDAEAEDI